METTSTSQLSIMKSIPSEMLSPASKGASRRGFLGLLSGALVATGISCATKASVAAPASGALATALPDASVSAPTVSAPRVVAGGRGIFTMLDHLSLEAFSAHLNTSFHVPDAHITLTLVEANDISRANMRAYELILRGPLDPILAPDTHLFRHAAMGDMALFISPFQQDADGTLYHITFSQLVG